MFVDVKAQIGIGAAYFVFFLQFFMDTKPGDFLIQPLFDCGFVRIKPGLFLAGVLLDKPVSFQNFSNGISVAAKGSRDFCFLHSLVMQSFNSDLFVHSEHKILVISPP